MVCDPYAYPVATEAARYDGYSTKMAAVAQAVSEEDSYPIFSPTLQPLWRTLRRGVSFFIPYYIHSLLALDSPTSENPTSVFPTSVPPVPVTKKDQIRPRVLRREPGPCGGRGAV